MRHEIDDGREPGVKVALRVDRGRQRVVLQRLAQASRPGAVRPDPLARQARRAGYRSSCGDGCR